MPSLTLTPLALILGQAECGLLEQGRGRASDRDSHRGVAVGISRLTLELHPSWGRGGGVTYPASKRFSRRNALLGDGSPSRLRPEGSISRWNVNQR